MTKYRVALALVVVTATTGATAWWQTRPPKPPTPPTADYPTALDLGPQKRGETTVGTFRVENRGEQTLVLDSFNTSCSCSGVEVHTGGQWHRVERVRIAPADGVDLAVRVAVVATPGTPQTVHVQFATNDPAHPQARVVVTVPCVTADHHTDPAALVFGPVPVGEPVVRQASVYDCGVAGRTITNAFTTNPDRFAVRVLPPDPTAPPSDHPYAGRAIGRVEVTARSDRTGDISGELVVELGGPTPSTCRLPLSGEFVGPVTVLPSVLYLPRVVDGKSAHEGTVRLSARQGGPVTATLEHVPDGLTAEVTASDSGAVVLRVKCPGASTGAETQPPPRRSVIRLKVKATADAATVEVPVYHP
ncbi:MAG: hypothetical protein K2X82_11525 [Gemmataceae bacterium]|nr:hypothetical protein [Gemmataceae bacterium]